MAKEDTITRADIKKPVTHKGKLALEDKAPKVIENTKRIILIKSSKTTPLLQECLSDIVSFSQVSPSIYIFLAMAIFSE